MSQNRRVFQFFDGVRDKYADPMHVYRKLLAALDGEPNPIFERAAHKEEEVHLPAQEQLANAARVAFDLAPFDSDTGMGATEADALAVVYAFSEWLDQKKTQPASTPTSEGPSESASVPTQTSPTPTVSGSGLTSVE